jgi:hypothetical protein
MGKKRTNKRRRIKKRTSKRTIRIGGEHKGNKIIPQKVTEVKVGKSSFSTSNKSIDHIGDAVNNAMDGNEKKTIGSLFEAAKDVKVKIDPENAKDVANFAVQHGPSLLKMVNDSDRNNRGMNSRGMGSRGMDSMGINNRGMNSHQSHQSQYSQVMDLRGPNEYQYQQPAPEINRDTIEAGVGAAKELKSMIDNDKDISGLKEKGANALGAYVTVTAAPFLVQEQAINSTVKILKGINDAPGAALEAAKRIAANPDSIAYIDKYGLMDGRTTSAIKKKISESLSKKLSNINAIPDKYIDTLDKKFNNYRNIIKCREKLLGDFYYSNRGDPTLYNVCSDEILTELENIRTEIENLKRELEAKTIGTISEIKDNHSQMDASVDSIFDNESYKTIRQEIITNEKGTVKLLQTRLGELKKFYDEEVRKIDLLIKNAKRKGGKNKSKKTNPSKKRKTLRKKRT